MSVDVEYFVAEAKLLVIVLFEVACGITTSWTKSHMDPLGKHSIPSNRDSEKKRKKIFFKT